MKKKINNLGLWMVAIYSLINIFFLINALLNPGYIQGFLALGSIIPLASFINLIFPEFISSDFLGDFILVPYIILNLINLFILYALGLGITKIYKKLKLNTKVI